MEQTTITIASFARFRKEFLDEIGMAVQREFHCKVTVKEMYLDISSFFDPGRRQYNGDALLRMVDSIDFNGSTKVIGLFNVDLFIPILTYIFGQAQLGGRTGIASTFRLSNLRYGIEDGDKLLTDRFKKEVIHELGHQFGLIHCHTPICVMRSSTYVEDIDQKEEGLCSKCYGMLDIL